MENDHVTTSQEDNATLKQRLEDQNEELAESKKILKEELFKRWRAEEGLRESEEKNKRLLESIEDGYYEVDVRGSLVFFNNALSKILGYSREEMTGMNNRQYMSEETAKTVYETFNAVYRTGKPTKAFDWELITKRGEKRYLETSVSPVRDSSGQVTGFSGIARDVTERRLARKALEESEEKYRTILETIEDGYYEVDLEGTLTFFNEALCRVTGYSLEELHGMNNRDYTEPETARKMFAIFNRVYRTGEPSKIDDYEVIKKDGTKAVVELSTALMRNSAGEGIGFRGIARDVTEREKMKQALKGSEEKYRTIIESIADGYYEVDLKGNFVFFNESMCRILGYPSQELKGMNNRHFMSEETAKRVFQTFNQVYRTGEATKVLGWELIRKDGERRYVETSVSLLKSSRGEPAGFRGIARDITELKALEKARERVINHLSHELGTPLSIIESVFAKISRETESRGSTKLKEWVERGERNVGRLRDLQKKIEDILNHRPVKEKEGILHLIEAALILTEELGEESSVPSLWRSVTGRLNTIYETQEIYKERIALGSFLNRLCDEAADLMKGRQIEVMRAFENGVVLEIDRTVLSKAFGGILKNAIENTPDEGRIEVRAGKNGTHVTVEVQDFGVGITHLNQKMIFGGFFHTQETSRYASKRPYWFNAGGAGADLLRTKVFSERFGFAVDFSSRRCKFLPSDQDECPGRVSLCSFITNRSECLSSGGSTFSLLFPVTAFSEA